MKKFIAAALSILVGAFGYTIVDSTIEDRVSRLESEVYELRENVSDYHNQNVSSEKATEPNGFFVGKKLVEERGSRSKFLIRIHDDGLAEYLSPKDLNNTTVRTTTPFDGTTHFFEGTYSNETTYQNLYSLKPSTKADNATETSYGYYEESFKHESDETTQILDDPRETIQYVTASNTTTRYHSSKTPGDYFVYLDTVSAVVSYADIEPSYYYDDDYSLASKPLYPNFTITITYQGKADPALAGERIEFRTRISDWNSGASYDKNTLGNIHTVINGNIINPNGSFSYTETRSISLYRLFINFSPQSLVYSVQSVELV